MPGYAHAGTGEQTRVALLGSRRSPGRYLRCWRARKNQEGKVASKRLPDRRPGLRSPSLCLWRRGARISGRMFVGTAIDGGEQSRTSGWWSGIGRWTLGVVESRASLGLRS